MNTPDDRPEFMPDWRLIEAGCRSGDPVAKELANRLRTHLAAASSAFDELKHHIRPTPWR